MRKDMAKVVTERPRRGHGNTSKKWGRRLHRSEYELDDHGPTRVRISRRGQYGWNCKSFSDLLGPLRGYLKKQAGRHWDDVWSELSAVLDKRSITGQHIFDHIDGEVQRNCFIGKDGEVYALAKYRLGAFKVDGLYIHPETGILCYKQKSRYRWNKHWQERARLARFPGCDTASLENYRIQDEETVWERRNGHWFILKYEDVPASSKTEGRLGDQYISAMLLAIKYNHPDEAARLARLAANNTPKVVHVKAHKKFISARQAGKKEIRRAKALLS